MPLRPARRTFTLWRGSSQYDYSNTCIGKIMATKKVAKKAGSKSASKPIKQVLGKSGLVEYITTESDVVAKDVRAVLAALEGAVIGSVNKNGARSFVLPGLLKITVASIAAKPKRKGINPFTKVEQWFAAKPATVRVKVRPLKKLKDAAA
jgi:nucleoid DNA-binding protein